MQYKTYIAKCKIHPIRKQHLVIASSEEDAARQFRDLDNCYFDLDTLKELNTNNNGKSI